MAQTFTIGRGEDNDIVIASPYLSSKHLTIELIDAKNLVFRLVDQNSTNGTFVNGQRVEQADITPNDQVHLGEYLLKPADYMHKVAGKTSAAPSAKTQSANRSYVPLTLSLLLGLLCGGGITALLLDAQQWLIIGLQTTSVGLLICAFIYGILLLKQKQQALAFARELQQLNIEQLQTQIEQQQQQQQLTQDKNQHAWNGYRKFEVIRKQPENSDITSFYLQAHDKRPIPKYFPGQYLTFNLQLPNSQKSAVRCYSLSDAPNDDHYRISIKRQAAPAGQNDIKPGLVSNHFHDAVEEGDIVDVKMPSGSFYLDSHQPKPVVLLAGGIGITPMLAMLNSLIAQRSQHPIWLFYGVRNGAELIHVNHLRSLAESHDNLHLLLCFSQPDEQEQLNRDYHIQGRVTVELLEQQLPSSNFDFYLCGPGSFMDSLNQDLKAWGVPDKHIHSEAFGPSSVSKKTSARDSNSVISHKVVFTKSDKTVMWSGDNSLLELAENNGIDLDHGCRAGNCGTCLVAVREGDVQYSGDHDADVEQGSCLACICQPASDLIIDA